MNALEAASLVMIPSGYEDGTLGSLKPLDGTGDFTFSRGSNISATRVNADGNIEKGYENLLLQSNTFSDAFWEKSNTSVTSGQSGYDGTTDAWLLTIIGGTGNQRLQVSGETTTGVITISTYVKQADTSYFRINSTNSNLNTTFDLSSGTIVSTAAIDATITSVGNDWYKVSVTAVKTAAGNLFLYVGSNSQTSGSIYIQDAQINQGLVAYPYVETTTAPVAGGILEDMPRLDYSNGSCPSLLLEPSRTNVYTYSEYFDAGWSKTSSGSGAAPIITSNYGISPEGLQNATRAQFNTIGGASFDRSILRFFATLPATAHTNSFYIKSLSGSVDLALTFNGASSKVVTATEGEWTRVDYTGTGTTSAAYYGIECTGNTTSRQADVLIWGAQLEEGSYPTSYIPTYGVSQTRLADVNVASGLSSVIGQTEGTIFIELDIENLTGEYRRIIGVSDGNLDNSIQFNLSSSGSLEAYINQGGTYSVIYYGPTLSTGVQKLAITYKTNEAKIYRNGTLLTTDTSVVVPACSNLYLGKIPTATASHIIGNKIKQALLFDTALSDEACIELTTI